MPGPFCFPGIPAKLVLTKPVPAKAGSGEWGAGISFSAQPEKKSCLEEYNNTKFEQKERKLNGVNNESILLTKPILSSIL